LSEKITIEIPVKLAEFIDTLAKEGFFISREDFARCSIEIIAQLYGLSKTSKGGKSLLDVLIDNGKIDALPSSVEKQTSPIQKTTSSQIPPKLDSGESLSTIEMDILDLFVGGAKFEFEDALHARYTMELMKLAKAPIAREEFIAHLESLAKKGNLEKTDHSGKTVWKILESY